jgi:hypothetical protein
MKKQLKTVLALAAMAVASSACVHPLQAQTPDATPAATTAPLPPIKKFKATDADNHSVLINKPGTITLLLGTDQDSQDAARSAGQAVYPFRGRPDFQLIVVVDLRDSIAAWAPSVVLAEMRSNLDKEAVDLKPYFLANGNTSNPRNSAHVIADFTGTICPQLDWPEHADDLRAILFGGDGREIKRWDKLTDMNAMQADVRAAIEAYDKSLVKAAAANKQQQGSKLTQPPTPPRPLPPSTAAPGSDSK